MTYNNIVYSFKSNDKSEQREFELTLEEMLIKNLKNYQRIIILCIGSDYSVGDSLGPLIGHKLIFSHYGGIVIYGTLEFPVDAENLKETLERISNRYTNPFIIAIDSSLGPDKGTIGNVTLCEEGVTPGDAFGKTLPKVGHISISGTVNVAGIPYDKFIRTTRMHLVVTLADFIVNGLLNALDRITINYSSKD